MTISAPRASDRTPFVRSLRLNGRAYRHDWVTYGALRRGARLAFDLGGRPSGHGLSGPPPSYGAESPAACRPFSATGGRRRSVHLIVALRRRQDGEQFVLRVRASRGGTLHRLRVLLRRGLQVIVRLKVGRLGAGALVLTLPSHGDPDGSYRLIVRSGNRVLWQRLVDLR